MLNEINQSQKIFYDSTYVRGFPGGLVVKNPANAGDTGLIPCLGRSHTSQSN